MSCCRVVRFSLAVLAILIGWACVVSFAPAQDKENPIVARVRRGACGDLPAGPFPTWGRFVEYPLALREGFSWTHPPRHSRR